MEMPNIRKLLLHARSLFPDAAYLDPETVRHNRRAWVRARIHLGDQWILAKCGRRYAA